MTAGAAAPRAIRFGAISQALSEVAAAVHRIPERLRHRRFWEIQVLMAVATATHYAVEMAGTPAETPVHDLAISLYMFPLLYAALSFGWEGTLMTALLGVLLTSPSTWIWEHSGGLWMAELAELGMIMGVGLIVAWRVDIESKQRLIAQRRSASLKLLNSVAEVLSNTLDAERQLPKVADEVHGAMGLQSIMVALRGNSGEADAVIAASAGRSVESLIEGMRTAMTDYASEETVVRPDGRTAIVVLHSERGCLGYLAASVPVDEVLGDEQTGLLENIGHEITVAVENSRLYHERQESMQSYVRQVTQAQEDERLRIARELHDETAQELVLLVRQLERLDREQDSAAATESDAALALARNILSGVRRFSRDLRPSVLDDLGLVAAIEMVVDQSDQTLPGGASLRTTGHPHRLDPQVELAVFRIAQEALHNVSKHARANEVVVTLSFEPDQIRLTVVDDGEGFQPPDNPSGLSRLGKLGVLGMKERAELVGGAFELRSAVGKGTQIEVVVPC